jgi:hypothetical protein
MDLMVGPNEQRMHFLAKLIPLAPLPQASGFDEEKVSLETLRAEAGAHNGQGAMDVAEKHLTGVFHPIKWLLLQDPDIL